LTRLRGEFERSEQRAVSFQVDYLLARQRERSSQWRAGRRGANPARILLLFEPETYALTSVGVDAVRRAYPRASIDVMVDDEHTPEIADRVSRVHRFVRSEGRISLSSRDDAQEAGPTAPDLLIVFVQDPSAPIASDFLVFARSLPSRRHLVVDCNFNIHRSQRYWLYRLRSFGERVPYMLEEPSLLFATLRSGIALVLRRTRRRLGRQERWQPVSHD
jgi:hypothetical protein